MAENQKFTAERSQAVSSETDDEQARANVRLLNKSKTNRFSKCLKADISDKALEWQ